MGEHWSDSPLFTSRCSGGWVPAAEEVLRIKVRLDYFPRLGELDTNLIARSFPGGAVVRNNLFSWYDRYHVGIAGHDLVAQLYDTLKVFPEPF